MCAHNTHDDARLLHESVCNVKAALNLTIYWWKFFKRSFFVLTLSKRNVWILVSQHIAEHAGKESKEDSVCTHRI